MKVLVKTAEGGVMHSVECDNVMVSSHAVHVNWPSAPDGTVAKSVMITGTWATVEVER